MNNITLFTLSILMFTGCASGPKFKYLGQSQEQKIRYVITYPSFSGMTKNDAKAKRKEFMETTMNNIYASIFRLGYYGRSDFNPNNFGKLSGHSLSYGNIPFIYKGGNPPTIEYNYNTRDRSRYGKISSTSYSAGNRRYSGGDYGWSYPIAETESGEYITSPKQIQSQVSKNVMIITRSDFDKALSKFRENHKIIDANKVFTEFLRKHAHKFVNYRIPLRSLKKTMFTKYKSLQSGAGLSDEVINMKNTLSFSLKEEINRQLVWGLMFLLNSELEAKRLNKKQLEVVITVPVNRITKMYSVQPLSKFIEP